MKKQLSLIGALMLFASGLPATAAPVEYKIPATQEEFEAAWKVAAGTSTAEGTDSWTWVDGAIPYAKTTAVTEGEKGASLIYGTPMTLKAGDVVYLQANVSSEHYNDDEWFYIVYGTDVNNLQDMKDDFSSFKCWGISGGGVDFKYKPVDSSNMRELKIETDGDYYFGVRSKKGTASYNVFACAGIKVEKSVNYPQKVTKTKAEANKDGLFEVTLTWTWPTKNKNGDAIKETLSANIYRSMNTSDIYTAENLIGTVNDGVAGESGTFVDNATNSNKPITESGKYYYYVAPVNAEGENSECSYSTRIDCKWVGEDIKPLNPIDVSAKAAGDNVEVYYTKRVEGYNGGWINPEELVIKIERQKNGGEFVVLEESYKGESPYVDSNLDGPGSYVYQVCAVYKGGESSKNKTDKIFAGGVLDLPYNETFDSADSFYMLTVHSTSSSYPWKYSSAKSSAEFGGCYSEYSSTLVTPPLKLKAGVPYEISFDAWVNQLIKEDEGGGETDPWDPWGDYSGAPAKSAPTHLNVIRVLVGQEASESGMKEESVVDVNVLYDDRVNSKVYISVKTDGNYYIGFKASAKAYNDKKYLDNISVKEAKTIPATIEDLKADTDKGNNHALVSFTVPKLTNTGAALSEVTKVEVSRAGEDGVFAVVKTLEGAECVPGTVVSFTDEFTTSGKYSYSVVSYLDEEASEAATTAPVWYGYDEPKAISAYGINVTDGKTPTLTWSGISGEQKTVNAGYFDAENVKYRVYCRSMIADSNNEDSYVLIGEVSKTTFTDVDAPGVPWGKYYYSISVVNGGREGKRAERSSSLRIGDVIEMPYEHDFTTSAGFDYYFEGRGWYDERDNTNNTYTYSATNRGVTEGQEFTFYLPPFRTAAGEKLGGKLTMGLSKANAEVEETVEVYLCTLETEGENVQPEEPTEEPKARTIEGENDRILVTTVNIDGTPTEPSVKEVGFTLPSAGRYRLAVRLSSPDSKGVNLHSLKMENNIDMQMVGIIEVSGNEEEAIYYNLQGIRVDNPENGLYIRKTGSKSEKMLIRR